MTLNLIPILVLSFLSGLGTWFFQAARLGADLADSRMEVAQLNHQATTEKLAGERRARQLEDSFNEKARIAATVARDRERADARRLDAVRAERDRLRLERDEALTRFAQATPEAQLEYVTALDAVFGECAERYEAMAGAAAGHASDVVLLSESWPVTLGN